MKKKPLRRQVMETAMSQRAFERGYREGRRRGLARCSYWRGRYSDLRNGIGMAPLSDKEK